MNLKIDCFFLFYNIHLFFLFISPLVKVGKTLKLNYLFNLQSSILICILIIGRKCVILIQNILLKIYTAIKFPNSNEPWFWVFPEKSELEGGTTGLFAVEGIT